MISVLYFIRKINAQYNSNTKSININGINIEECMVLVPSILILALFYIGFIAAHKFISKEERANKISSIVAIIGLINVPIIKYSVEWWNTLHQPASIKLTGSSTIHSSMLMPLMLMFFVLLLYCALIFLMKYKTEIIRIKKKNLKRL